ncbi:MAG: hypothetical protein J7M32_09655, partial [Deltaproteobacteria bacterium]|nr:hypothetical protein [Deltaproteobacteria bacterium]
WQERSIGLGRRVSPADKSLKRPARRPGAQEKSSCPGGTVAVIPPIIELMRFSHISVSGRSQDPVNGYQ